MEPKKILQIANKVYPNIRSHYGLGKKEFPPIEVYKNILVRLIDIKLDETVSTINAKKYSG